MSGKSKEYWISKWDNSSGDSYEKARDLLLEYCGSFKHIIIFDYVWGGSIGRFFKGRWGTHHGDIVQKNLWKPFLSEFVHLNDYDPIQYTDHLLENLEEDLKGRHLEPNGDLYKIIEVIKMKIAEDKAEYSQAENKTKSPSLSNNYDGEDF